MNAVETEYEACIAACQECVVACEVCISHMLVKKSNNDCPNCCRQCIAVCNMCIGALSGDWLHTDSICKLTSEVAAWCACNCREHDNEACQHCAEACERCAATCRELVAC